MTKAIKVTLETEILSPIHIPINSTEYLLEIVKKNTTTKTVASAIKIGIGYVKMAYKPFMFVALRFCNTQNLIKVKV